MSNSRYVIAKRLLASLILLGTLLVPSSAFAGPDLVSVEGRNLSVSLDINVANSLGETGVASFLVYENGNVGHLRIRLCTPVCQTYQKELSQSPGDSYSLLYGWKGRVETSIDGLGQVYLVMHGWVGPVNAWAQVGPRTETAASIISTDPDGTILNGVLQFSSRMGDWGPIAGMDGFSQGTDLKLTGVF